MRKAFRGFLSLAVLIGTVGVTGASAGAATAAEPAAVRTGPAADNGTGTDIKDRILAIPGMSLIEEKPYAGYRYFVLNYTQPIDHRHPSRGTFQQRITVLHKDTSRPTVFSTSGYNVSTSPGRAEPTRIIDGNQVSLEYRYFTPSRPAPADWTKLDIRQAADDQHRVFTALKRIYTKKWLTTGASKGGMTATYYERFHPGDMDGVVAYVAPNDVVDKEDSAYDRFFENVGTKECRDRVNGVQREALVRREPLEKKYREYAAANGYTFDTTGSLDKAYEAVVMDYVWAYWQYSLLSDCDTVPADAESATDQAIWDSVDSISGFSTYTDQSLERYTPYYYQAGTQLGSPDIRQPWVGGLSRYGYQPPRTFVPRSIPMRFQPSVMRDIDNWVKHHADRMLYVYGENDPWGAERFRVGAGSRDSYVMTEPGGNHGASVAGLAENDSAKATAAILRWAGVAPAAVRDDPSKAKPLAKFDARLDRQDVMNERRLRP
ncbi:MULTISPECIES: S28 family serine protease [unclassified Streptomyces]|uniref:S28 family serine protease n=1 Tax=unclassified Streptomyces TaxID=2593676 RepID=UPI002256584D|nr:MULTISPECIES: S28 family serine protease [unclassified Streptomyces]WSG50920.1 aminopeptidase [Streptomyces sp. NBC_01732]WSX01575.1 aminopeptidase [Streptomyces sp. NBC_00987]MCX4396529.1 S28 family serine protease [Streptomyces sp. NBC_01767]MCX5100824.1 S28 family serine protease [Streptomyces sp. NBC_00439]MCX5160345.1 S28 family serine protease [Streptomyces sp. NBC_00305]